MLRVLHIVEGTSVDGPGLRTSIYLAGCNHHCPGCHNPQSWDFKGGEERTLDELMEVIAYNEAPVTLSGGDPLQQPAGTRALIHRIKQELGYNCGATPATLGKKLSPMQPCSMSCVSSMSLLKGHLSKLNATSPCTFAVAAISVSSTSPAHSPLELLPCGTNRTCSEQSHEANNSL